MAKSRNGTVHNLYRILDLFQYCEASGLIDIKVTRKELTNKLLERCEHLGGSCPSVQEIPSTSHSVQDSLPSTNTVQDSPPSTNTVQDSPPSTNTVQDSPPSTNSVQPRSTNSAQDSPPSTNSVQDSPTKRSMLGSVPLGCSLEDGSLLNHFLPGSPTPGGSLQGSPTLSGSLQGSPTLSGSLQDSCKPSKSSTCTPLISDLKFRFSSADGPGSSQFLSDCDLSGYDDIQTPEYVPSSVSTSASGGRSGNPVGNNSVFFAGLKTALFGRDSTVSSEVEEDVVTANKISSGDENPANERNVFEDSSPDSSSEAWKSPSIYCNDHRDNDDREVSAIDGMNHNLSPPQPPEDTSSSDNENDDDNLEQFFSKMTLQQLGKKNKALPSSASVNDFVVSDSEDVIGDGASDGDQDLLLRPSPEELSHTPPVYHTPHVPAIGLMFWGSPDANTRSPASHRIRSGPHTERKLLPYATSVHRKRTKEEMHPPPIQQGPHTEEKPLPYATPRHQAPPTLGPLTTPSYNKNFCRFRSQIVAELFAVFNKSVFDEKLPPDMDVIWNKKLRTTAGYCYYLGTSSSRTARIELSNKVVDSYGRTQSTLVHEMCHAATWIVDGLKHEGHGSVWKAWADKVRLAHPDLKPVTRCHAYLIQYKHYYKCVRCDFRFGRHSKSVNLQTARCPHCTSYLEYVPRVKADGTLMDRKLTRYAAFVKGHYSVVKGGSPWRTHKQVMEKLCELYKVGK